MTRILACLCLAAALGACGVDGAPIAPDRDIPTGLFRGD
ncbi:MAG: hypothetical protein ACI9KS_000721 [Sulfitobacter sp.]|jgi:hypothetical protein